jgi:chaperonin cofactor prefoldin
MKITKDSLLADKAKLEAEVQRLEIRLKAIESENDDSDENVRTNISTALNAPPTRKQTYGYSSEDEPTVYNWYEIFREIGKLLERKKQDDLRQSVSEAHQRIDEMQNEQRRREQDRPSEDPTFRHRP